MDATPAATARRMVLRGRGAEFASLPMPSRRAQVTQVGKRTIELSNLNKVLFPDDGITKAHLIEYYYKIAPTILAHVKGRPLSLVRFPDGIGGESFYQKNRPDWAPEWLEHVTLGEEKKDYVLATEEASLVWLANLACIELHQMHARAPHFAAPDYIVYDFDPPDGFAFSRVAELAMAFKEHLEAFGYHPFVKTTGRKGLHVLTPIEPRWTFEETFKVAKVIAQPFVESHASALTLQIKKDARGGRVLLDIYRNRQSQSIVAAYSVRGLPGAPVSMPLHWEELATLKDSQAFDLHSVPQRVLSHGDPWEAIAGYATPLHTASGRSMRRRFATPHEPVKSPASNPTAPRHKTPAQLASYAKKRAFERTPEPPPSRAIGSGAAFVVHRHHASRLHYDLRLEQDGVLKSWAVPKGLPPRPGIMRLAVNVEDHPLDYVNFEGAIPKGEYGGGMMWRFAQGRYEITRQKKDGFYFRLQSPELNAEYRMHRSKDNQWLLERVDQPQPDWLRDPVEPMLAASADRPPASDDYLYEIKWDGLRALIALDEGVVRIHGRNRMDMTKQFPELLIPDEAFRATSALFDGEIVCLDAEGRPVFQDVIHRMHQKSDAAIARARASHPAVCFLFDCLYLDGRAIVNEPLVRRREWLQDAIKRQATYRLSDGVDDGPAFFAAVRGAGLEGIVAKQRSSTYRPGKRSDAWLKIKTRQTTECLIIGYTRGQGERSGSFGALHLAQPVGVAEDTSKATRAKNTGGRRALKYVGKVGTGFDDRMLRQIAAELKKFKVIPRPVEEKPVDDARSIWLESNLLCEVQFASRTRDGALREPVFLRLRPDLTL